MHSEAQLLFPPQLLLVKSFLWKRALIADTPVHNGGGTSLFPLRTSNKHIIWQNWCTMQVNQCTAKRSFSLPLLLVESCHWIRALIGPVPLSVVEVVVGPLVMVWGACSGGGHRASVSFHHVSVFT